MSDKVVLVGKIGPTQQAMADGGEIFYPRFGRFAEQIVGMAGGEYEEAASRGEVFHANTQAGVTFGTGLTLTAVTFTLYNPIGSLVDLVVLTCAITVRTCTVAGHIVYAANVNNAAAAVVFGGTNLTPYNGKLDGSAGYAKVAQSCTLPAAPVAIRTLAYGDSTVPTNAGQITDEVKGAIILGPNTAVTIQGITFAGTGIISMSWRERKRLAA